MGPAGRGGHLSGTCQGPPGPRCRGSRLPRGRLGWGQPSFLQVVSESSSFFGLTRIMIATLLSLDSTS